MVLVQPGRAEPSEPEPTHGNAERTPAARYCTQPDQPESVPAVNNRVIQPTSHASHAGTTQHGLTFVNLYSILYCALCVC